MPSIRSNNADIYYETTGKGKLSFFLVHGITCDKSDWSSQIKPLSAKYQVVTCDLRGHGQSTGDKFGDTIEVLAEDVNALIEKLDLQNVILVGHSMGCRVVLEAYLHNFKPVRGIVLVDGSLVARGNAIEARETTRKSMEKAGYSEFMRRNFADMFFGDYDVNMKDRIVARALKMNPDFGISLRSNMAGWDAAQMDMALSSVRVPLMVVQSTGTKANSERFSLAKGDDTTWLKLIRSFVPAARIETLAGYGHFIMLEAPDVTNKLLLDLASQINRE
jgi:pimeloyl-ACP methyl ester carboxylesterase